MILLLGVYVPDVGLVLPAAQDIFNGLEVGNIGVLNIVVTVLAVAAYALMVVYGA